MKHYNEEIITHFVLGSEKIAGEREAMQKHLDECYSCRELYESVKLFYGEIERQNIEPLNPQKLLSTERLILEPLIRSVKKAPSPFPKTIISKQFILQEPNRLKPASL